MSLMRIALRRAAVEALRGKTLVGDNVLDSEIGSLDIAADGTIRSVKERPFIAVYTGDAKVTNDTRQRAFVANGATELIFEIAITAAMTETNSQGETVLTGMGIPGSDANYELHLDLAVRQIGDTLTDPENGWAEVFRSLINETISVERATLRTADKTHLAAHQLRLGVDLFTDPVRGIELKPQNPLAKFLDLLEQGDIADPERHADMLDMAAIIRAQLTGNEHAWQTALRRYGLTRFEADAMLITPQQGEHDVVISGAAGHAEIAP